MIQDNIIFIDIIKGWNIKIKMKKKRCKFSKEISEFYIILKLFLIIYFKIVWK